MRVARPVGSRPTVTVFCDPIAEQRTISTISAGYDLPRVVYSPTSYRARSVSIWIRRRVPREFHTSMHVEASTTRSPCGVRKSLRFAATARSAFACSVPTLANTMTSCGYVIRRRVDPLRLKIPGKAKATRIMIGSTTVPSATPVRMMSPRVCPEPGDRAITNRTELKSSTPRITTARTQRRARGRDHLRSPAICTSRVSEHDRSLRGCRRTCSWPTAMLANGRLAP